MGIDLGRFKSNKNDDWLSWLTDDPIPASIRARMRSKAVQEASRPVVRRVGEQNTTASISSSNTNQTPQNPAAVSINITIPKFKTPSIKKMAAKLPKNLNYKQLGIGAGSLILAVSIGFGAYHLRGSNKPGTKGDKGVLSAHDQKPTFGTLTPSSDGTVAADKKYDPQKKVVSYTDAIGGVTITVSQQQLPGGFQDNPQEKVKKLAEDFSATEVLSTANPTAYLGTSAKGPQTVIFTKNGLLVFIQSANKIDTHDWAEYITNLK